MFFGLDDVQRRHNPTWWTNNVTAWHTAVDSTPSWNYQRGIPLDTQVSSLVSSPAPCSNISTTSSHTPAPCSSTTNLPPTTQNGPGSTNIPEISSPAGTA